MKNLTKKALLLSASVIMSGFINESIAMDGPKHPFQATTQKAPPASQKTESEKRAVQQQNAPFSLQQEGQPALAFNLGKVASSNDNLLFSIIRNKETLSKIMGRNVLQSEVSTLQGVRQKIFDDIRTNLDREYDSYLGKGGAITKTKLRDHFFSIITNTNSTYSSLTKGAPLTTAEETLQFILDNNLPLDSFFAEIISVLYGLNVQVMIPSSGNSGGLRSALAHPVFVKVATDPLFVLQTGIGSSTHFDKLYPTNTSVQSKSVATTHPPIPAPASKPVATIQTPKPAPAPESKPASPPPGEIKRGGPPPPPGPMKRVSPPATPSGEVKKAAPPSQPQTPPTKKPDAKPPIGGADMDELARRIAESQAKRAKIDPQAWGDNTAAKNDGTSSTDTPFTPPLKKVVSSASSASSPSRPPVLTTLQKIEQAVLAEREEAQKRCTIQLDKLRLKYEAQLEELRQKHEVELKAALRK